VIEWTPKETLLCKSLEIAAYQLVVTNLLGTLSRSLTAFARSVAALVPSDYRGEFLERAMSLHTVPVAPDVCEYERASAESKAEAARAKAAGNSGTELAVVLRTVIERRGSGQNGTLLVRDLTVSLKEYKAWQEALRSLDQMQDAVMRYSYADGRFTPTNVSMRSLVWLLFLRQHR
jgi:hypothetical protein